MKRTLHAGWEADESTFDAPSTWCDRRCERCPLAADCRVGRIVARRSAATETAAVPDSWADFEAVRAWLAAELQRTAMGQVSPVLAARTERLALRYAAAAKELAEAAAASGADESDLDELGRCFLVAAKAGRVAGVLALERKTSWQRDAVPNLLLLEHLDAEIDRTFRAVVPRLCNHAAVACFGAARAALWRVLAPWLEIVPDAARAELAESIRAGGAPSPFCVAQRAATSPRR
jgi:hypothetical protein